MGGQGSGGYGPSPWREDGRRGGGRGGHGGGSQDSYGSGRDFGGQGGYGGYGESAGGQWQGQRGARGYWGGQGEAAGGGSLRGKGPKGWKRSDARIQEDVCERLSDDHEIDASDISVSTQDGVVTLEGSVGHRAIKHRVEDLVEQCSGVVDIRNHLTVRRDAAGDAPPA